jgi:predicted  nucleic acid-binding Zn-ribbon protein
MRRTVLYALVAAIVLLLGATAVLFTRYQTATADYQNMKAAEETAQARYSETINAIAEIQDSLNAISLGDTTVRMLSRELESEQRLTGPDGREALDRIAALRAVVRRSKERIRQLESSLKSNGNRIVGLEKMVANLKRSVAEKEDFVAQLSGRVDSLQTQVAGLVAEVQQNQDTLRVRAQALEEKRRELATVYYVVGTKKHLTASGVVVARGGVLGLGTTLQPSGRMSEGASTPLDTDRETVIPIPSAKARVLSAQPPSSYELKLVGNRMELHILDPREFRTVKQLVILTA